MYKLKIDIVGKDGITSTYDGDIRYDTTEEAREAKQAVAKGLYDDYSNYQIKGFQIDIIPTND